MFGDRYRFILIAALVVAAGATYGVYRVITDMRESSRVVTQPVVVAGVDIAEGAALKSTMLAVMQMPVSAIPAGGYSSLDSVVSRVARVTIFKGEAIVPGRLAPEGTSAGIEVKITPGKRAMAVRIDDVAGLNNLIQPNSRVDVMVTIQDQGDNATGGGRVSKMFMENMRVLSVGQQFDRGADGRSVGAGTATLEVTPEEAERLAVAGREGSIQLVLRGYGDPDSIKTDGARPNDVLKQLRSGLPPRREPPPKVTPARRTTSESAPKPVPAPTVPTTVVIPPNADSVTVRIYRGTNQSQQKFMDRKDSLRLDSLRKDRLRRDSIRPPQ